jgi:hypothetical protein
MSFFYFYLHFNKSTILLRFNLDPLMQVTVMGTYFADRFLKRLLHQRQ